MHCVLAYRLMMFFADTNIDPWFLVQIEDIVHTENQLKPLAWAT